LDTKDILNNVERESVDEPYWLP